MMPLYLPFSRYPSPSTDDQLPANPLSILMYRVSYQKCERIFRSIRPRFFLNSLEDRDAVMY